MNNYKFFFLGLVMLIISGCSEDRIEADTFGSIAGTVTAETTDEPLSNVKITTSPASNTVFTDSEGRFEISNVLVDSYSVEAELDSYTTAFEGVEVLEDITSDVAIEMRLSETDNQAPSSPELIYPEDGATNVLLEVEFAWDSVDPDDDDLTYVLELRNGSTNETEEFTIVSDTTYTVNNLVLATNYFWQVIAKDELNEPVSSQVSSFTTFAAENNPFLFIKRINGNSVIFSGDESEDTNEGVDANVLQLTDESKNSFRPKRNNDVSKIAFLRTIAGENQIFTMNLSGSDEQQITSSVPVTGFRQESIQFTWAESGQRFYYPNFDKLYAINNDGSGLVQIYQTTDGSLISDIAVSSLNTDTVILKTNDVDGYNARIFAISLTSGQTLFTVLENLSGAVSGIDVSANLDRILYARDISGSENSNYRIFNSRIYQYDVSTGIATLVETEVVSGENDLFPSYSPDEGRLILTRVLNNQGAIPSIFSVVIGEDDDDNELFTAALMPDWE
ncbi:carboxypeptidase-like regulatory domain-containing protein [Dokdonia sp. Hel_I_53]|uniref:carboxypeptidase-like regulatory domain-containing protein n=1 Tax=Dokdonia sp. Hel_I_53 TaxID=1566287 RepID=UPI001199AA51|nr:carboxypeptidase-like regulatory domain-containing protein [Dokdonia sp. Hel_I_53]TVZ51727.1 carboxypeptidase family protein [Dokdonia sp. Hel_I_53]